MEAVVELPRITIMPQTEYELDFFKEMLYKMKATFEVSKANERFLTRFEAGLREAKSMKEGKLAKKPLRELYG